MYSVTVYNYQTCIVYSTMNISFTNICDRYIHYQIKETCLKVGGVL